MNFVKWIQDGITHPRLVIYLKGVAILMLLSAFSHLGSIMGIIGGSWVAKPWLFRLADLLLLPISLVLAWGLWRTMFWAVVAWLAAVVLFQAIPFLFFGEFFRLRSGLINTGRPGGFTAAASCQANGGKGQHACHNQ